MEYKKNQITNNFMVLPGSRLVNFIDSEGLVNTHHKYRGEGVAFPSLKSTNGFSSLPGGERYFEGCSFYKLGEIGFWWSSTKEYKFNGW